MSSPEEILKDIDYANKREHERKVQESHDELLAHLETLREAGEDPLAHLMYRDGQYEPPYYRRPEELVSEGLSAEQIADLVRAATEDSRERFGAMNDFAAIFAREAMTFTTLHDSSAAGRHMTAAFELQARATEELVQGMRSA